jgi:hypothetical protein
MTKSKHRAKDGNLINVKSCLATTRSYPGIQEKKLLTQDPDEEAKVDGSYSVRAKCPPLTEKEECKEGEDRNTQVEYEEEQ